MLQALSDCMPEGVTWTSPGGGMFIWVTLPDYIDAAVLLQTAIRDARVAFIPGAAFYPDHSGRNTLRLSYSLSDAEKIAEGIRRLARIVKSSPRPAHEGRKESSITQHTAR